jgi:hypothetical protein
MDGHDADLRFWVWGEQGVAGDRTGRIERTNEVRLALEYQGTSCGKDPSAFFISLLMARSTPLLFQSLDILHYLLQSGLHLPRTQPRSRAILSSLQNLSQNPTDDPEGTAGYVKGKAGECLVSAGYLPGSTSMNGLNGWAGLNGAASGSGSGGSDGFWGFGWGRNKEKEKEKERERQLAAEQLKKQREWMAYQQKLEQEAAAAASASAWKGLDRPKGWKIGSTSKVGGKA